VSGGAEFIELNRGLVLWVVKKMKKTGGGTGVGLTA
jgi:hypothetical protein